MNSRERVERAVNLQEADHVPVGLFMVWHIARVAGVKISDFCWNVDASFRACRAALDFYGGGFDTMNVAPMLLAHANINPLLYSALYFDWRFFDDDIPQFRERELGDETLYDAVLKKGFSILRTYERVGRGRVLKMLTLDLVKYLRWMKRVRREWDLVPFGDMVCYTPAELMMFARANGGFVDLRKRPGKLIAVNERWTGTFIRRTLQLARLVKSEYIYMPCLKFSASFVNPKVFETIQWPAYREMAEAFTSAGFRVILHLDGDWEPLLDHFADLTPKRYVMELDITDMKKAKEKVGRVMCIKGNVNPLTLATGTPGDVERECRGLIDGCAPGGGFILGSGCEAPPNSRPENIRAMIRCASEYGKY